MLARSCVDLRHRIRGERIDVVNIGVQRIDVFLIGRIGRTREREQRLASKARLEGEDVALRKLSDKRELQGVFDGGRAADSGQEELKAGEILKPSAELGLVSRAPLRGRLRRVFISSA